VALIAGTAARFVVRAFAVIAGDVLDGASERRRRRAEEHAPA
jgi:hypothetical protein